MIIKATLKNIPDARAKIAFDKFHVAKYLGAAVDKVRKYDHMDLGTPLWGVWEVERIIVTWM